MGVAVPIGHAHELSFFMAINVKRLGLRQYLFSTKKRMIVLIVNGGRAEMMGFSFRRYFFPLSSLIVCLLPLQEGSALTITAGAGVGYEVLSYRDSATKVIDGSVSTGDVFEQTSFTGAQYGVSGHVGVLRLSSLEPLLSVDLTQSQLKKKANDSSFTTSGTFSFLNGGLSIGTRFWMSQELSAMALVGFSQALSNSMMSKKLSLTTGEALSDVTYEVEAHKRTSIQLGMAYSILQNALLLGLDLKVGSGCFECTAPGTPKKPRAYLTRSGALTVSWMLGQGGEKSNSPSEESHFESTVPRQVPSRGNQMRQPQIPAKQPAKNPPKSSPKNKQKRPAWEDSFND